MEIRSPRTEEEWADYYNLRYEILRKPWNQPLGSEKDGLEGQAKHFAYFDTTKILGVGRLDQISPEVFQIRFMAVSTGLQKRGIGRLLMEEMESVTWDMGGQSILLHARENALGFYHSLGYELQSTSHLLFGEIQHYLMKKKKG